MEMVLLPVESRGGGELTSSKINVYNQFRRTYEDLTGMSVLVQLNYHSKTRQLYC